MNSPSPIEQTQPSRPPPPRLRVISGYRDLLAGVLAVQRRELRVQGLWYGISALVVFLLVGGFLGFLHPALSRALLIFAPIMALATFLGIGVWLPARRLGDELDVARLLATQVPELSYDVLAAVEIDRALIADHDFSPDLARAFLRETDRRAQAADPRRAIDERPRQNAAMILAGVLSVAALALLVRPGLWMKGATNAVRSAASTSAAQPREPITGDVELFYRYPSYTGLQPRTVTAPGGEISAVAGTEVKIKTRSDRPVVRAEAVIDQTRVPLVAVEGRELTGSFVLAKSGSYRFVFYGKSGRILAEGPEMAVHVEPDEAPQVNILAPAEELEVDPGQKVVLKYSASDDFGLTALELVYRPPRATEDKRLPLHLNEERRFTGEYRWDLSSLKLGPGERVSYFIAARDNDEVSGQKLGVSRVQYLKIYSASEHRQDAIRKAEVLWERLVGHLATRLEGPDRAADRDPQRASDSKAADTEANDLVGEMVALGQELSRLRDAPEELWTALMNIASGLQKRVAATVVSRRNLIRALESRSPQQEWARRLVRSVEEEIKESEKDVLYLEGLLDRAKFQELKELTKQLSQDRRELASLIEQYQQSKSSDLRESILRQTEALRSRIDEMMRKMSELAKGIRDEHLNVEALKDMSKQKDLSAQLDEIQKLLREDKTEQALAKLQEMAMQLDQMTQQLEGSDEQLEAEQNPELTAKFQEFIDSLQQTTQDQKHLAEQTKEVREHYRNQMRERLAQKGQALKEQLMKTAEEVARDYQQILPEQLNFRAERPLEEAQAELENLRNALKIDDFDLAAESALRAERAAGEISAYAQQKRLLEQAYQSPPDILGEAEEIFQRTGKDAQKVRDIAQKLQQLFPPAGSMLSEADKAGMKQLSSEQRQVQKKAQGLRQQMDELSKMAPIFGEAASEQMDQVGERMGGAVQRLDAHDPARGYGEQKAALEQLQRFQQQMKEAQGKRKGRGMPMPMFAGSRRMGWDGSRSQEPVQLPEPDQSPNAFRKDLLDAMKQAAPEKYKEQVKRYYEDLVK